MKSQGLEWSWKGGCEEMGIYLAVIINNLISVTRRNSSFFYTSPYLKKTKNGELLRIFLLFLYLFERMAEILGLFPHEAEHWKATVKEKNEVTSESSRETQSYFHWEPFLPPGRQEK